ncbi:hypothetical protein AA313_de0208576 [Arthrobotrys entomopaga]|nr:hypothetical protein AA313_de0208576 [Arthrobotrys entomopaga]
MSGRPCHPPLNKSGLNERLDKIGHIMVDRQWRVLEVTLLGGTASTGSTSTNRCRRVSFILGLVWDGCHGNRRIKKQRADSYQSIKERMKKGLKEPQTRDHVVLAMSKMFKGNIIILLCFLG